MPVQKRKFFWQKIKVHPFLIVGLTFLIVSLALAVGLVQQRQEIRKMAGVYPPTPSPQPTFSPSPSPLPSPSPSPTYGCTNPSGSFGASRCADSETLATCTYGYGMYYWRRTTCFYGCLDARCRPLPSPSPSPGPSPTPAPVPSCECVGGIWQGSGCDYWLRGRLCSVATPSPSPTPTPPVITYIPPVEIDYTRVIEPKTPEEGGPGWELPPSDAFWDAVMTVEATSMAGGLTAGAAGPIVAALDTAFLYGYSQISALVSTAPPAVQTAARVAPPALEIGTTGYTAYKASQGDEEALMWGVVGAQAYSQYLANEATAREIARARTAQMVDEVVDKTVQMADDVPYWTEEWADAPIMGTERSYRDPHQTMYFVHREAEPSRINPRHPKIRELERAYQERLALRRLGPRPTVSRAEVAAEVVYEKVPYIGEAYDPEVYNRARTFVDKLLGRGPELGRLLEEAGGGVCLHQGMCVSYFASGKGKEISTVVGTIPKGRHAINQFFIESQPFAVDVAGRVVEKTPWLPYIQKINFYPQYFEPWQVTRR